MILSSGHIISAFDRYLKDSQDLRSHVTRLCNFEVETRLFSLDPIKIDETLAPYAILNNIITRGFPTYCSYYLEQAITEITEYAELDDNAQKDSAEILSNLVGCTGKQVFEQLGIGVKPTSYLRGIQKKSAESSFEYSLVEQLENECGSWVRNVISQQVELVDLYPGDHEFTGQQADYVIAFPSKISDLKGLVVEMDGDHHSEYGQADLDKRRDNQALYNDYLTIRISVSDTDSTRKNKIEQIAKYLNSPIFDPYRKKSDSGDVNEADSLILLPLVSARIQLCIIRAILNNSDWLQLPAIHLALLERDISGTSIAVGDINHWLSHLSVLTGSADFPIITFEEFSEASAIDDYERFQAIIDISGKARSTDIEPVAYPNAIVIRNAPLHTSENRVILTGPHINYQSFGVFANMVWTTENEDRVQSLKYFLRSIFRKNDFRTGQLPILNRSLQGLSVIGLLPTGGGKSLTYQLSAMMQPGICMVIDPIISLMQDQVTGLKRHWIDACVFVNSTIKNQDERAKRQKLISEGKALFFFISPERLLIEDFRSYLEGMGAQSNPVYFSYCVIDEAHCVSEWGHDFRTSYLSVAENAIRFCKLASESIKSIPIFALTATASYDVLTDIQRELSGNEMEFNIGEEAIVEPPTHIRPELNYQIRLLSDPDLQFRTGFNLKSGISGNKNSELKTIIESHETELGEGAGLIFCPHRSHFFGVTDRFKQNARGRNGVLDHLLSALPQHAPKMGFFMGSSDTDQETQKAIQSESVRNQDLFIEGETNLLVATKAFGMGIDKSNIRFTVHYNYPSSIESFLQEAGRAGRDGKKADCYLLYTDPDLLTEDAEFDVNFYFHSRAYKGALKEKEIISELLFEISEPDRTYELTADIQNRFGIDAVVTIWQSNTGNNYVGLQRSYDDRIASMMIRNNFPVYLSDEVKNGISEHTVSQAHEYMDYLISRVQTQGNAEQIWNWLNTSSGTREGIQILIENGNCTAEKYSGKLIVAWENNIAERIRNIQKFVHISLNNSGFNFNINEVNKKVRSAIDSALNFNDLIEQIDSKLHSFNFSFEEETYNRDQLKNRETGETLRNFEAYYNQVRDKSDTEKAIYRMRLLGVIDDYTVDYRTQTFKIYFSKKPKGFFSKRLKLYLSKFFSDERVEREIEKAYQSEGNNDVHRLLNFLIDFGYDQIANKRMRAIHEMSGACKYGLDKSGEELAEFLNLYLNSKYSRDEYLVDDVNESLVHRLDHGTIDDTELVWHYVELMERDGNGEINNLKHLRGATSRMLVNSPTNPVLLILKSYATYFLEYSNQRLIDESEFDLSLALDYLEEEKEWTENELMTLFNKLVGIIQRKRPEIKKHYEFDFENFRFTAYHRVLVNANNVLTELDKTLNNYGR